MVFFGFRERSFNCFFSPGIESLSIGCFRKPCDSFQSVLPYMAYHLPSCGFLRDAFISSGTVSTIFTAAPVFSEPDSVCCSPVKVFTFRTDICIEVVIISESIFSKRFLRMSMPSVPDYSLDMVFLQQMSNPCTVVAGVKSHVLRQVSQSECYLI